MFPYQVQCHHEGKESGVLLLQISYHKLRLLAEDNQMNRKTRRRHLDCTTNTYYTSFCLINNSTTYFSRNFANFLQNDNFSFFRLDSGL